MLFNASLWIGYLSKTSLVYTGPLVPRQWRQSSPIHTKSWRWVEALTCLLNMLKHCVGVCFHSSKSLQSRIGSSWITREKWLKGEPWRSLKAVSWINLNVNLWLVPSRCVNKLPRSESNWDIPEKELLQDFGYGIATYTPKTRQFVLSKVVTLESSKATVPSHLTAELGSLPWMSLVSASTVSVLTATLVLRTHNPRCSSTMDQVQFLPQTSTTKTISIKKMKGKQYTKLSQTPKMPVVLVFSVALFHVLFRVFPSAPRRALDSEWFSQRACPSAVRWGPKGRVDCWQRCRSSEPVGQAPKRDFKYESPGSPNQS